jgi:geranylgeranyl diphosphate synthase, type I
VDLSDLNQYIPKIEASLRASYAEERRKAAPPFQESLATLNEFTLRGGKRFRAILVLAGYYLATNKAPTAAVSTAAALEHFQSWMLIHDDIIDHSERRRGGPTVHRALESSHAARRGIGSSSDYGTGIGITLGDLEEPFTVEALLSSAAAAKVRLAVLAEYTRMTRETAYGQLLDIQNGTLPPGVVTEEDVLLVHRLKSAVYTVASPLRIGATLGGAAVGLLEDLETIGIDLGVAFQLRDDVLGTGFEADASGKSANDLIEGKRTLLVIRAWSQSGEPERAVLTKALGNPAATPAEVEAARDVIRNSGSLAYSEERIRSLTARAEKRIARSRHLRPPGRKLLREIADRLVNRAA